MIAAPVAAQTDRLGDSPDGPTQLAPGAIAVALWLGAFVTYLLRPAVPPWLLARPRSAAAVAFAGLRPGLAIGAVQVGLLYAALLLLGVDLRSPVVALVLMLGAMARSSRSTRGWWPPSGGAAAGSSRSASPGCRSPRSEG